MKTNIILSNIHQYQVDDAACELLCRRAVAAGVKNVLLGPSSLGMVRKLVCSYNLSLFTSIAYPSGAYFADQKAAEIRELVSLYPEIEGFLAVSAVGRYISGHRNEIAEELRLMKEATCGRKLYYVTEAFLLSDVQLDDLCDLAASADIDGIVSTAGFAPYKIPNPTVELLARLVKAANNRFQVVAGACFAGQKSVEEAFTAGAHVVVTNTVDDSSKLES